MKRRSQPPGFRFQPTHVELVVFYLKRKVLQKSLPMGVISVLDIYKYAPWDLPDKSCMKSGDLKWYFFCPIERKYASGARIKRATEFGYWKSTGNDRPVVYKKEAVGKIKTLTFFRGKAPKGDQTDWVMHEYRIEGNNQSLRNVAQDAYVLCVIFQKDGPGPRNGAQYGAPFNEDDWDSDGLEEVDSLEVDLSSGLPVLPSKEPPNSLSPYTSTTPSKTFGCPSTSCISENLASSSMEPPQVVYKSIAPVDISLNLDNDDGFTIQDFFPEGNLTDVDGLQAAVAASNNPDQNDTTFEGLEDICSWFDAVNGDGNAYGMELNDLDAPLTTYLNSAYNCPFGAANQYVPYQFPPLPSSTDLGYPDAHMSAFSQFAWLQENIHPNSNEGCSNSGFKAPWSGHDWNHPP